MRVVSLLPSATEVLVASSLSNEDDEALVGRSHECDYPVYVQKHPVLTSAKNKFESCSQMNEAVCTSLSAGDSLYDVDAQLLKVPTFLTDVLPRGRCHADLSQAMYSLPIYASCQCRKLRMI